MESEDTLLLANGSEKERLREMVKLTVSAESTSALCDLTKPMDAWTLGMRFPWPEELWHNNVHTASYATELGFEHPLVEGPAVADRVWWRLCGERNADLSSPRLIEWRYQGPLYEGARVNLLCVKATPDLDEMVVFRPSITQPDNGRVLMSIRISNI